MRTALLVVLVGVLAAGAWWWQRAADAPMAEAEVVTPPPPTGVEASPTTPVASPAPPPVAASPAPSDSAELTLNEFDARWLEAENGDADAAYEVAIAVLGCLLDTDSGRELSGAFGAAAGMPCEDIPTDRALADRLFRTAAEAGHVDASREYAANFVSLSGIDLSAGARSLNPNDVVALAARDYQAMEYLEFAATQGDLAAAKLLARRLASGFSLEGVEDASILVGMRNSEPEQALAWYYAVQIIDGDQTLAAQRATLREALDPQQILQAQARGQELYTEHFTR
ncbi:MAG: hypothetical protein AAFX85_01950 [Pseudomonadota bacterium]